ncbi:hypothetical protein FHW69_002569 [Luteibacter sp. Sphag1AF]|uniref:hypothetical protein n=1 Tax=Luteibacter sp. Sphag1AF TaxID=2587031 RepID=UPI0016127910|nr:hypothetical protein [Luteibacter sp. Sphag1AF]MBB3227937.1 hypothetical protein [Luteibacter sp. Sphag1AF]
MFRISLLLLLLLASLPAFAAKSRYVDVVDYPSKEFALDRFDELRERLNRSFDFICGDTFCEGDYSNLRSIRFTCSADSRKGYMQECLWTFFGSYDEVLPATGEVTTNSHFFQCRIPLAPRTPVEDFYSALEASDPMEAPLPGTGVPIYEVLTECL